jgi:hypothetical protein
MSERHLACASYAIECTKRVIHGLRDIGEIDDARVYQKKLDETVLKIGMAETDEEAIKASKEIVDFALARLDKHVARS